MKSYFPPLFAVFLMGFGPAARAQSSFEIGALALASAYRSAGVSSGPALGNIGFKPGPSAGAFLGQTISDHVGGELRYIYAQNDLKLSSGGTETTFGGRSHIVHYDLMLYSARRNARVRPYFAGGGGLKYYQGTGTEQAFQPLSNLALLTRTNEALPMADFGGGIKFRPSGHTAFRVEFRDYISKVPSKVFAASPGARSSGILHQWLPAFGISWTF